MALKKTDREQQFKRLAFYYLEKWAEILHLSYWQVELEFSRQTRYAGKIKRDYRYYRAKLTLSSRIQKEQIEEVILHELIHLLVGEIQNKVFILKDRLTAAELEQIREAEEQVTERLTKILITTTRRWPE